ncbi:MAG TPA: DUF1993 domain-containing protein [Polyangiaceae bacterium]|nr:DUF1993 domain-containing protein [Polyangiaceae bacterium]
MSLYESTILQFKNTLAQIGKWLDAGAALAETKKFDVNVLLNSRLAPDQFPLLRQVQSACDAAKATAARLTGQDPPKHPDTETTLDELRARIAKVVAYLDTFTAADFAGAEERKVVLPFIPDKHFLGADYVTQLQLPNFYFHASHAYAILRHNGVALGKTDYLGHLSLH